MQVPCLDCPDRAVGCHGKCEKYKEFQAFRRSELAARSKKGEENAALFDMARKLRRRK